MIGDFIVMYLFSSTTGVLQQPLLAQHSEQALLVDYEQAFVAHK
jgi:hypothetical protein